MISLGKYASGLYLNGNNFLSTVWGGIATIIVVIGLLMLFIYALVSAFSLNYRYIKTDKGYFDFDKASAADLIKDLNFRI